MSLEFFASLPTAHNTLSWRHWKVGSNLVEIFLNNLQLISLLVINVVGDFLRLYAVELYINIFSSTQKLILRQQKAVGNFT